MKILAISDTPSKALWDYCTKERLEGGLPHYEELDVKTRRLLTINGLDNVKGLEK